MSKFIGRLANVGIAKETARGTAVVPAFWLPKQSLSIDDKITQVTDETSVGVIEGMEDGNVAEKFSEAEIEGRIDHLKFGLLVLAALGSEAAPSLIETGVYDHVFTVLQSAQHPSLTVTLSEPNAQTTSSLRYTLAMLSELNLEVALRKFATYKAKFRANAGVTGTSTPAYATSEQVFLPQTITAVIADVVGNLGSGTAVAAKSIKLNIKKNTEDDFVVGSVVAADRLNKQLEISGEIELMYNDRSFIDTYLMADLARALRVKMLGATLIGATAFPTITIDFNKVKFSEVARKFDNNGLVLQTLKFDAYYDLVTSKMTTITVRNTQSTAY